MNPYTWSVLSCIGLFVGMAAMSWAGHRHARALFRANPLEHKARTGVVDAAIFSLLGLLIAFTFSSAYSRYEQRRELIVEEVNAIGTAYLRVDLLPPEAQPEVRRLFHQYAASRIELWERLADREEALAENARSIEIQGELWQATVAATQGETGGDARKLLLPALNEMFDITTVRLVTMQAHPPIIIFFLLGLLSLAAAWIVGFGMAEGTHPSRPHVLGLAALIALSLYMILDIEYPRHGLVRLDATNELFQGVTAEKDE